MDFNLQIWKEKLKDQFQNFKYQMQQAGITSVYYFISASALWPLLAEVNANNLSALAPLFTILAPLGSNLIANQVQRLKDYADKKDVAVCLEQAIAHEPALQKELDVILDELDALRTAQAMVKESDRKWFATTMEKELKQLGQWQKYKAVLRGDSSALAQGNQAMAVGSIQSSGQGPVVIAAPGANVQINPPLDRTAESTIPNQKSPRQKYLERLYRYCLMLPLAPLGGEEGTEEEVTLDQVYIALNTTTPAIKDKKAFQDQAKKKQDKLMQDLLAAYKKGDREKFYRVQSL